MKTLDNHFENYINVNTNTLHPKLESIYNKLPDKLNDIPNLILYGPGGVGKYKQALQIINKYSPSNLKYEKKISLLFNKNNYTYKISDVHLEVDMDLLGCNSKQLWHEIYNNYVDIVSAKTQHHGIILCKNFQDIHSELLDLFYSYMQKLPVSYYNIKFILITEQLSFIPDNICNSSYVINIPRPSKSQYIKTIHKPVCTNKIDNIKNILLELNINTNQTLIDRLYNVVINNEFSFSEVREILYDVFIYNINVYDFIWCFIKKLVDNEKLKAPDLDTLMNKTADFLQLYNNNYRPIYHLEKYIYCLLIKINGYSECV